MKYDFIVSEQHVWIFFQSNRKLARLDKYSSGINMSSLTFNLAKKKQHWLLRQIWTMATLDTFTPWYWEGWHTWAINVICIPFKHGNIQKLIVPGHLKRLQTFKSLSWTWPSHSQPCFSQETWMSHIYCVLGGYVMGLLLNTICTSQTLQLVCLCHHGSAMCCVGVVKVWWSVGVIWWKCGESLVKVWGWCGESLVKVWEWFGESVVKVWWKCGESLVKWAVPFAKVLLSLESSNSLFVTLFVHCITCPELP